jgi:glycosyltransferase involved in cell wall biosynthesis
MVAAAGNGPVSVLVVFLNEERFLEEAVASVYAQTWPHWEILLADDGSTDRSTEIAKEFARRDPTRVRYLEHPGHQNRGASATRNLAARAARGEWIAFLDGDDVWLPMRLERSVALAQANPDADMVYAKTEYWHSWQGGEARQADRIQPHYFRADRLLKAPELLARHLSLRAAVPCMGSLLVRRQAFLDIGGFDDAFRGLVDDAVFLGKFLLHHDAYVSNECWDRYRQHAGSDTAVAGAEGKMRSAQRRYLAWLREYVEAQGVEDRALWRALNGAIRRVEADPAELRNRVGRLWRRLIQRASEL